MSAPLLRLGDRYEVGGLLGRGGMADVYLAHDTVLDRDVAVKLLRDVNPLDALRFGEEARHLAGLNHPGIVTFLDAGIHDERPWLALELVDGASLEAPMRSGPLAPDVVSRIAQAVAAGLAHAHDNGIVHRDVKPANVLLGADGSAKLSDFGIARPDGADAGLAPTGHTMGTAAYVSPEQVRGEPVTGAGDVYALGLLLLEALTAVRAYPGPVLESSLARLERAPLIPTSLPRGWPGLLASMTALDPSVRPSAAQVVERISALPVDVPRDDAAVETAESVRTAEVVATPGHTSGSGPRHQLERRVPSWTLVAAAVLVLLFASAALVRAGESRPPEAAEASAPSSGSATTADPEPSSARPSTSSAKPSPVTAAQATSPTPVTAPSRVATERAPRGRREVSRSLDASPRLAATSKSTEMALAKRTKATSKAGKKAAERVLKRVGDKVAAKVGRRVPAKAASKK